MKYCPKCNKVYQDEARFCGTCGEPLVPQMEYDIFGEPLERKEKPVYNRPFESNNQGNAYFISKDKIEDRQCRNAEMLALISVGLAFLSFYGIIFCIISFINNLRIYKLYKRNLGYLILSIITTIISIAFMVLLIKYHVLEDLVGITEETEIIK